MAKHKGQNNQIDDFLLRIENRERTRRRNRLLLVLGAVVLLGGGFQVIRMMDSQPQLRSYQLVSLNADLTRQLFQEKNEPIVVHHPGLGTDTIRTPEEYLNLRNVVEMMDNANMLVADRTMADGLIQDSASTLGSFFLDVAGVRKAGESLQFTIENYDDQNTYMMDFGNGYRRRVRQNFSYTYPRQGNFQAKLIATRDQASSLYVKNLRISPGEVAEPNTQIASAERPQETRTSELPVIDLEGEQEDGDSVGAEAGLRIGSIPELEIVDLQAPDSELSPASIPEINASASDSEELTNIPVSEEPEPVGASPLSPSVMITADIMPEYPGGTRGIARYFQRNYRYPFEARQAKAEGVVHVRFVVQPNGKLTDFVVVKGVGYGCDQEAIRLLKNMPKWRPGEHQGQAVAVYRTLPITFKLVE